MFICLEIAFESVCLISKYQDLCIHLQILCKIQSWILTKESGHGTPDYR